MILLTISLLTLSNLPSPTTSPSTLLLFHRPSGGAGEEEEGEEELLNSRTVLELAIVFLRLLAQSALLSSLISLLGTLFFVSVLSLSLLSFCFFFPMHQFYISKSQPSPPITNMLTRRSMLWCFVVVGYSRDEASGCNGR
jgi:hypothetical protein